nr:expressed protein [Hymenolepis microstoma]
MGSLYSPHISVLFFTVSLLGFFQSGFLPLGFEFAAEITYPTDEAITSDECTGNAEGSPVRKLPINICQTDKPIILAARKKFLIQESRAY